MPSRYRRRLFHHESRRRIGRASAGNDRQADALRHNNDDDRALVTGQKTYFGFFEFLRKFGLIAALFSINSVERSSGVFSYAWNTLEGGRVQAFDDDFVDRTNGTGGNFVFFLYWFYLRFSRLADEHQDRSEFREKQQQECHEDHDKDHIVAKLEPLFHNRHQSDYEPEPNNRYRDHRSDKQVE